MTASDLRADPPGEETVVMGLHGIGSSTSVPLFVAFMAYVYGRTAGRRGWRFLVRAASEACQPPTEATRAGVRHSCELIVNGRGAGALVDESGFHHALIGAEPLGQCRVWVIARNASRVQSGADILTIDRGKRRQYDFVRGTVEEGPTRPPSKRSLAALQEGQLWDE